MTTQPGVRQALHIGCAVTAVLTVAGFTLAHFGRAKRRKDVAAGWRLRLNAVSISALVFAYCAEAAITATKEDSFTHSQAHITHVVLLAVAWSIVGLRPNRVAHEVWGLSLATTVFEAPLIAFSPFHDLGRPRPLLEFVCQVSRLLIFLHLLADRIWTWLRDTKISIEDETRPFLRSNGRSALAEEPSYGTVPSIESPDTECDSGSDEDDYSGSGSDSDSDDERIKRLRRKRLRETGGWWGYIKDFSVFLPFLIPRQDRKVQLCIVISVLCIAANRVFNILVPRQLGIVTDLILDGKPPYSALAVWLLLSLLDNDSALGLVERLAQIPIKQFSYRQVTNAAFSHVMNLSMEFHSERDSAEVMKAIEQGEALANVLETVVIEIAPTIIDLLIAFGLLYWKFNAYVSLIMVIASIFIIVLEVVTSKWNVENRRKSTKAKREEARVMHQAVQGWQTVSYFNMFSLERRRFGQAVDAQLAAARAWERRDAYTHVLRELLVPTTLFSLSCLVIYEISQGRASAGDFVFLLQYWDNLIWPLKFLSQHYRWLMADMIDAERLLDLLKTKPTVSEKQGAKDIGPVRGHVAFRDVSFSYNPRKPTLKGLDFAAQPGQTVALVGATGAGKSSIIKLLLRFYDVTSGAVEIDGHDVRDVTLGSLRTILGVVPQDPLLFNASIRENVRYARPAASDEDIYAACRAAAIHDKILGFADGYDTGVGEQGVKLSGGEVQRLAIARVFLKDPPVLILDEATSAVDTNTEWEIQRALDALMKGRTTFVIAHRLSTVVDADRIMVLDDGQIVESGTHQELLAKGGRYKNLWAKQVGENGTEPKS